MGKIRVKTIGDDNNKKKKDNKKTQVQKETSQALAPGASEAEVTAAVAAESQTKKEKKKKFQKESRGVSKNYAANIALVNNKKTYTLPEALSILTKFRPAKFDETVELHINVKEKGISGSVALPHGTGKKIRVKIVDDAVIAAIEKGVIDFDILVAHPSMMAKLAKVARILGPRGLMPNPKAGTISPTPEEVVEKLSAGQVNFKTESAATIIHMSVGKVSFGEKQLTENITAAYLALPENKIDNITLKATMTPGIRLDTTSLNK